MDLIITSHLCVLIFAFIPSEDLVPSFQIRVFYGPSLSLPRNDKTHLKYFSVLKVTSSNSDTSRFL
jgi:hypothetical protein